ncbi:MAG: hypothetical protein HY010_19510 [Acidobacteria bacterium]|nr:hypothetical protein [Acidobacteriota bacterium]
MNTQTLTTHSTEELPKNRIAPIVVLILLSPLVGEVLSGATRLSYMFAYLPEVMMWGCGTLLIREAVRRWHGDWTTMLPLGFALSVAEEFIVQQTSLAPLPFLGTTPMYGRVWGVNWIYFLFMLGFESVFITLVPVQIVELIFPKRRHEPWLRTRGIVIASVIFLLGAVIAWFLWVKIARIQVFHMPDYRPPMVTILIGLLAIVAMALASYALRGPRPAGGASHKAVSPALVLPVTMLLAFPWYILMALIFVPQPLALWIPVTGTIAWAAFTFFLLRRWVSADGWGEMHEWALSFGALLVCMIAGFLGSSLWPRIDLIAKIVLNGIAFGSMILLAIQIRRRSAA